MVWDEEPLVANPDGQPAGLDIPPDATAEEAAAIAAAIEAYLDEERAAAETGSARAGWAGRRWAFGDRLTHGSHPVRVPETAPTDPWTAAGRADRF